MSYAKVTEVIDGDTIKLETGETVRYLEVNSPEIWKMENDSWVKTQECFSEEAKKANEELVLGKTVKLEKDVSDKDKYGRLLRYIWLCNSPSPERRGEGEVFPACQFINLDLVKTGFASSMIIKPDTKFAKEIIGAEKEAKDNNLGLWKNCQ